MTAFLDEMAQLVGDGTILELGSGTGAEANYVESLGPRVERTDATPAFVKLLGSAGHSARRLDIRTDAFGGPYRAVMANAVLLHLDRNQFEDALLRARRAVTEGGVLACTLKEGDGAAWSNAKLDLPRHFTYWREAAVRDALARTGWRTRSLRHVDGHLEPWLYVIAIAE